MVDNIMTMFNVLEREDKPDQSLCVVRLVTTVWIDARGVHQKRSLNFLKRKCKGYNILIEDCQMVGASEIVPRIINLNDVVDGIYQVVTCNEIEDRETGSVEQYDYKLVLFEDEDCPRVSNHNNQVKYIYCPRCGYEDFNVRAVYSRTTADGAWYVCPSCRSETCFVEKEDDEQE